MRSRREGLAVLIVACLAGCARTVMESSVVDAVSGPDAELEYWEQLEARRVVTNHDALHGLILLAFGGDAYDGYEQRLAAARRRGWVAEGTELAADESATVGMIAVAACSILEIRGGLTMTLLGPSPRYCTRELVFLEILPPRTEQQSLSGLEFIDLLGRLQDRLPDDGEG